MISIIWSLLLNNPVARLIGKIALGILFLLTFGKVNQWLGAQGAKAKEAEKRAKAHQKTIEDVLRETPSDDSADDIRLRMSDRAGKP